MTVRVNSLKGVGAGRYYTDRLPSYYLDGEEPPGRWWGKATDHLAVSGEIDPAAFLAVMAGQDPATGSDLGRRFGEGSVRGYDATFSAPKSVSVLFAVGDDQVRGQVVDAHERAVEAVLGWVEEHAHTRLRRHGHIMTVDAEGLVVGVFRQHTSRRLDPQLHTHAVIANRVPAPDGRWLALDARSMMVDQRTLSALYHASLRTELTRRLGVGWETPEHGIAEIAGVPEEVLAEFSQRSNDIERRLTQKLERFGSDLDREPSVKERWRLEREAVLDSRPAEPHGVTLTRLHEEWRERTLQLGHEPRLLVEQTIGRVQRLDQIDQRVATALADAALASLGEGQSSWRLAEVLRELAAAVPTTMAVGSVDLTEALDGLADVIADNRCVDISRPVPSCVPLRRDGRPITEAAVDRALTTRCILDEEEDLFARAQHRKTRQTTRTRTRAIRFGRDLSPGQQEAVAAVAGDGGLELVVGPAGAGKTTMLASGVLNLLVQCRQAFGVAPTAAAAEVLATETGMGADTLDKLLTEHSGLTRRPQPDYNLAAGATVIVDEAATASTPKLAQLFRLADQQGWRLVLVGDPRQFSAVGRGGMFAHLVDSHGAVELDQVHRFRHQWERQASLRLRAGDPIVLTEYQKQGRLHGGTLEQMEAEVVSAWQQARGRGESVALMANSTETVARLNQRAQQTRILAGELDPTTAPQLRVNEHWMLIGDEVVTRRNDRTLRTDTGLMVKNRDHWTITNIHPDHSLTLTGGTGTIHLPAGYVAADLELGYAQTSHATQGRTVDTALLLIDTPTDNRGVYTPLTRGREGNHAYVVEDNQTALDVLAQAITRDWIELPAIARQAQLDPHNSRQSPDAGDENEVDRLEPHLSRLIAGPRNRSRVEERTTARDLV